MPKKFLGRKKDRENIKEIKLNIGRTTKNFDTITYRLNKADEIFKEYSIIKAKNKKWEKIKKVLDLVEINPIYNFEFLRNHNDRSSYDEDFQQLGPTLSENDYSQLSKKKQKNISLELYKLLNLFLKNERKFEEETKKIINNNYNIPLIEGNERLRVNYYFRLFSHYETSLNEIQKNYLLNLNQEISNDEIIKLECLKYRYRNLIKGIKFFKRIIPEMKHYFTDINLEEENLNIKAFTFMLYLTDIVHRITNANQSEMISKFFEKEIDPQKELFNINSLINNIKIEENHNNYGIKKKYDNDQIKKNDKNREKKINEYIIYNEFESIEFDGRNYVVTNLLSDFKNNPWIPLKILLLRNQSLSFFEKENNNFLNVKENIFKEFKEYFKYFIRSKSFKEALHKHKEYVNILNLVNDDNILNKFLNKKYIKSIPLFEFGASGYTNKDILVSCISGFPFVVYGYDIPETLEDYELLKGLVILFNVAMKLITSLHEIIIHFMFGYLTYVSEGEILSHSPKKLDKMKNDDGGLLFEQILFGSVYGDITLNEVLVILNGDCDNTLIKFKENLKNKINYTNFMPKSKLLKLIFKEYAITFKNLNVNKNIYSTMKSPYNSIHITRNPNNILLPFKMPTPNDQ